ncbi:MAG: polysaccharide deacetylase family protein, partial [Methyloligellaceae bacterium]
MRLFWVGISFTVVLGASGPVFAAPNDCDPRKVLGVSRTIEIDNSAGPRYGTHQYAKTIDLKPGEVVLTFDDGPHPQRTKKVLSALARHCTKATFFPVGSMALAYPETLKLVAKSGHTIGTHTYRHTNLQRVGFERGKRAIERGFAAILKANDRPIAPFFRFPYLRPTAKLHKYLSSRDIAILSVDVISGDTRVKSGRAIIRRTMRLLKRKRKGMISLQELKVAKAREMTEIREKS